VPDRNLVWRARSLFLSIRVSTVFVCDRKLRIEADYAVKIGNNVIVVAQQVVLLAAICQIFHTRIDSDGFVKVLESAIVFVF